MSFNIKWDSDSDADISSEALSKAEDLQFTIDDLKDLDVLSGSNNSSATHANLDSLTSFFHAANSISSTTYSSSNLFTAMTRLSLDMDKSSINLNTSSTINNVTVNTSNSHLSNNTNATTTLTSNHSNTLSNHSTNSISTTTATTATTATNNNNSNNLMNTNNVNVNMTTNMNVMTSTTTATATTTEPPLTSSIVLIGHNPTHQQYRSLSLAPLTTTTTPTLSAKAKILRSQTPRIKVSYPPLVGASGAGADGGSGITEDACVDVISDLDEDQWKIFMKIFETRIDEALSCGQWVSTRAESFCRSQSICLGVSCPRF